MSSPPKQTDIGSGVKPKSAALEPKADRDHRHRQEWWKLFLRETVPTLTATIVVIVGCLGSLLIIILNPVQANQDKAWNLLTISFGACVGYLFGKFQSSPDAR